MQFVCTGHIYVVLIKTSVHVCIYGKISDKSFTLGEDIADRDLAAFVHPLYLLVEEGTNATFYCYGTYGRGNYTYMWLDGMGKTVGNESILVLSSVSEVQSGNYTCVVFDERGMKVEESAELTVESKYNYTSM